MLPELDTPFRWQGDHIAAEIDGARALFTTRRGGVSGGSFDSLNLGRKTAAEEEINELELGKNQCALSRR